MCNVIEGWCNPVDGKSGNGTGSLRSVTKNYEWWTTPSPLDLAQGENDLGESGSNMDGNTARSHFFLCLANFYNYNIWANSPWFDMSWISPEADKPVSSAGYY